MNEHFEQFREYLTVKNIIFFVLIILLIKGLSHITIIAMLFFAGYIIASSLNPIVDKLSKKMNRGLAATSVLLTALFLTFAVFVPILYAAVAQIEELIKFLPTQFDKISDIVISNKLYGQKILESFDVSSLMNSAQNVLNTILNQSINITMSLFQGVLFFLIICMLVFYFMADKEVIKNGVVKLFPKDMKERASEVYDNISKNVGGYVIAQILSMVAVGALTALGMLILGVKYSLILGLFTGILDIIPILGPTFALILCLVTAYQLGLIKLVLVAVVFLAAQWASNNLVRPVIFGKFLNLHPLIIILSLLLAAQFLGIWGIILAPAIASLIWTLFDEIYIKTINKE